MLMEYEWHEDIHQEIFIILGCYYNNFYIIFPMPLLLSLRSHLLALLSAAEH